MTPERRWCVLARKPSDTGQGETNPEGWQVARIGCLAERIRSASIEALERSDDVDRIEEPKFPSSLKFFATMGQFGNGFCPDEIETRVGR